MSFLTKDSFKRESFQWTLRMDRRGQFRQGFIVPIIHERT